LALAAAWPGEHPEAAAWPAEQAAARPDAAVILTGANDVTHGVRVPLAVAQLARAVRELRATGCAVVVGTCPDLGTIRPVQPPLRWVARHLSRELARAQTVAVVEEGGATVSLADLVGPMFYAQPRQMFSADRFHPSADGYAAAAAAMLPTLIAAVTGQTGAGEAGAAAGHEEGVRSLARAAVRASEHAGTEVSAGAWWGSGRWVQLRRRVRQLTVRRQDPAPPAAADALQRPAGPVSTVE
ncbi:MAG: hypothetical protein J2P15_15170, partial [Micromonosporaceae bacterium]|nr:hypothetical protein [Micromonosporaceae bacterium]